MVVEKLKPRHTFFARILEQKSAELRKNAAETVRAAEEHVVRSEQIVSRSQMIVDRAKQTLNDVGWVRLPHPNGPKPSAVQPSAEPAEE